MPGLVTCLKGIGDRLPKDMHEDLKQRAQDLRMEGYTGQDARIEAAQSMVDELRAERGSIERQARESGWHGKEATIIAPPTGKAAASEPYDEQKAIANAMKLSGAPAWDPSRDKLRSAKTRGEKQVQEVASLFGAEIRWLDSEHPFYNSVGGFRIANDPENRVYLNANAPDIPLRSLGHELLHVMRNRHKDLYEVLGKAIFDNQLGYSTWVEARKKDYTAAGINLSGAVAQEEFLADFISENFIEPKFWKNLNDYHPTLAGRLFDIVTEMVNKIRAWLGKAGTKPIAEGLDMFRSLEKARDTAAKVLSEFARREVGPVKPVHVGSQQPSFSIGTLGSWLNKLISYTHKRNKEGKKLGMDVNEILANFKQIQHVGSLLGRTPSLLEIEGVGSPLRENKDYIKSFDLSTNCPRRFEYRANVEAIERQLGRLMTSDELFGLGKFMELKGQLAPCIYCYVEGGRRAWNEALYLVADMRRAAFDILKSKPDTTVEQMRRYLETSDALRAEGFVKNLLKEYKETKGKPYELTTKLFADEEFRAKEFARDPRSKDVYYAARSFAQGSTFANQPKDYVPYDAQFLNMTNQRSEETRAAVQARAGWRWFSNTDAQVHHIIDYMQAITDLAVMGDKAHAYTKEAWFVRIFGDTGLKINMSVFADGGKGGTAITENTASGMAWKDAQDLRKKFPDAGAILVATNDEQVRWGLAQPWIDMVIPWHRSGMTREQMQSLDYTDFTVAGGEKWKEPDNHKGKDGKTIKPPHIVFAQHKNDKATYLQMTEKQGLIPRFNDYVDDPNYMKLVVDETRPENPQHAVSPTFDYVEAEKIINDWQAKGGYSMAQKANVDIIDSYVAKIESGGALYQVLPKGSRFYSTMERVLGRDLPQQGTAGEVLDMVERWAGPPERLAMRMGDLDRQVAVFKKNNGKDAQLPDGLVAMRDATAKELQKYAGKYKRDELTWSHLVDVLSSRARDAGISRDDVLALIRSKTLRLKVLWKGGPGVRELARNLTAKEYKVKMTANDFAAELVHDYQESIQILHEAYNRLPADGQGWTKSNIARWDMVRTAVLSTIPSPHGDLQVSGVSGARRYTQPYRRYLPNVHHNISQEDRESLKSLWDWARSIIPDRFDSSFVDSGQIVKYIAYNKETKKPLPSSRANTPEDAIAIAISGLSRTAKATAPKWQQYSAKAASYFATGQESTYGEMLIQMPGTMEHFTHHHWNEKNVLAHARFTEMTDPDTGERVLLIDEIQSDWHQEGRKHGYKGAAPLTEMPAGYKAVPRGNGWDIETPGGSLFFGHPTYSAPTREEVVREFLQYRSDTQERIGIADAPFKSTTDWTTLSLKHLINYAVDNGFDRIAWVPGAAQIERWQAPMRMNVQSIEWTKNGDMVNMIAMRHGGGKRFFQASLSKDQAEIELLEDVIGKEMASQIRQSEETKGIIEGEDLSIGGEGMKGYYDQILPLTLGKHVKKWGAKLEEYTIPGDSPQTALYKTQSVKINDNMRTGIPAEGQSLFQVIPPKPAPEFFSQLHRVVSSSPKIPETMPAGNAWKILERLSGPPASTQRRLQDVLAQLKEPDLLSDRTLEELTAEREVLAKQISGYAGLFKRDELEWSGVEEWLEGKKGSVTRNELTDFLNANNYRVKELIDAEGRNPANEVDWYNITADDYTDSIAESREATIGGIETGQIVYRVNLHAGASVWDLWSSRPEDLLPVGTESDDDSFMRHRGYYDSKEEAQAAAVRFLVSEDAEEHGISLKGKFRQWAPASDTNYHEMLLQAPIPMKSAYKVDLVDVRPGLKDAIISSDIRDEEELSWLREDVADKPGLRLDVVPIETPDTDAIFRSRHWETPNVLVHVRYGDRIGPSGEKILHGIEIQSDWHQAGRKEGYRQGKTPQVERLNFATFAAMHPTWATAAKVHAVSWGDPAKLTADSPIWVVRGPSGAISNFSWVSAAKAREMVLSSSSSREGVPAAPYQQTQSWAMLGMKHLLKKAVSEGYAGVAWDPGVVHANRYDLRKHLSSINYEMSDGTLYGYDKNDIEAIAIKVPPTLEDLADHIGKEPAAKLMKQINEYKSASDSYEQLEVHKDEETGRYGIVDPNGEWRYDHGGDLLLFNTRDMALDEIDWQREDELAKMPIPTISGLDLVVGGKGLEMFYDRMLPDEVNKYVKKWGAKVGSIELDTIPGGPQEMGDVLDRQADPGFRMENAHYLPVTDAMRDSILTQGQTRFQISPERARELPYETKMPTDLVFVRAVANTPGAKITADGLQIDLVRYQKPGQEAEQANRTGVFYLPASSPNTKHYRTPKNSYGGTEKFQGEVLLKAPLFVKGATGGKAPESAFNQIKGDKKAALALNDEIRKYIRPGYFPTNREGENAQLENIKGLLERNGADPQMAWLIQTTSREGNTLLYAIQENIIAHAVRAAGYDSVVGYSVSPKTGPFLSEIFDVRELTYPSNVIGPQIHDQFEEGVRFQLNSRPWPADFPKVDVNVHPGKVSRHPDHKAAKKGDVDAAIRLVEDLAKDSVGKSLGTKYSGAKLVAVHAVEAAGTNAIPQTYAELLSKLSGLPVELGIVQSNVSGHTKKNALQRMLSRAKFTGDVVRGQHYVLVDDVVVQGGSLAELRHYIESQGGIVVGATTLAMSTGSNVLAIHNATVRALEAKFGRENVESYLKEYGIAGNLEALTNSEGRYILSYSKLDTLRARSAQEIAKLNLGKGSESLREPDVAPSFQVVPPRSEYRTKHMAFDMRPQTKWWSREGLNQIFRDIYAKVFHAEDPLTRAAGKWGGRGAQNRIQALINRVHTRTTLAETTLMDGASRIGSDGSVTHYGESLQTILGELKDRADMEDYETLRNVDRVIGLDYHRGQKKAQLELAKSDMQAAIKQMRKDGTFTGPGTKGYAQAYRDTIKEIKSIDYLLSTLPVADAQAELSAMVTRLGADGVKRLRDLAARQRKFEVDAILRPLLEIGKLSQERFDQIANSPESAFYASFMREMDDVDGQIIAGGKTPSSIKQLRGSQRRMLGSIEATIANVVNVTKLVETQRLNKAILGMRDISPEAAAMIERVKPSAGGFQPRGTITIFEDGKVQYWKLPADMAKAMDYYQPNELSFVWKLLSLPATTLRRGATLAADFVVRNPIRDQFSAMVYSKYGYIPFLDLARGMVHFFGNSALYQEFKAAGGEQNYFSMMDREAIQLKAAQLAGFKEQGIKRAWQLAKTPLDAWIKLTNALETGTRLGEYSKARKAGVSAVDAAAGARDLTLDFQRKGGDQTVRAMNMITAFWNANLQGTDKLRRELADPATRTGVLVRLALGITLPSILLWALFEDDERWRSLPGWRKNFFWNIPVGKDGPIISIPKPFELGLVFGSLPERILDWLKGNDPKAMSSIAKAIKDGALPGALPTAMLPFVESAANYSFFRDGPIESASEQKLPPSMRFSQHTSTTVKRVGELTNLSPKMIENWIQAWSGNLGKMGLDITDKVAFPPEIAAPAKHWYEVTPGIRGFVSKEPIGSAGADVDRFYDNVEKIMQAREGWHVLAKNKSPEAQKFKEENMALIRQSPGAIATMKYMGLVRRKKAIVANDQTMSAEEKREQMDLLDAKLTDYAKKFNSLLTR